MDTPPVSAVAECRRLPEIGGVYPCWRWRASAIFSDAPLAGGGVLEKPSFFHPVRSFNESCPKSRPFRPRARESGVVRASAGRYSGDTMPNTKMQALLDQGQSVWLDYLRRGMTRSGELSALIDDGLRGMTSNPTIFEQALSSTDYDEDLAELSSSSPKRSGNCSRPWRSRTCARPPIGFARSTTRPRGPTASSRSRCRRASLATRPARSRRRRRLWKAVDRPNVMIKIPGTREGLACHRALPS